MDALSQPTPDWGAWRQHGHAAAAQGDHERAVFCLQRAIALNSNEASCWEALALAALSGQRWSIAEQASEQLSARFPQCAGTHLVAGHIHKMAGRSAAAVRAYERALVLAPGLTEAVFNLVELQAPAVDATLVHRVAELSSNPLANEADRANLGFARGRILDAAGEFGQAFSAYADANSAVVRLMSSRGFVYDPARSEQVFEQTRAQWSSATVRAPLDRLPVELRLIFIVGMPRSGSTLIEQMLSGHPAIEAGGELTAAADCERLHARRRADRGLHGPLDPTDPLERELLAEAREFYLDRLFDRELDAAYVTDKAPGNFARLGFLRLLFPDAVFVHSRRHPVATCWSLFTAHFGQHDPYYNSLPHLAHYYRQYARLMTHWETVVGLQLVDISYEELVSRPQSVLTRLLNHIGLEWDERCLDLQSNPRPVLTASYRQVRMSPYRSAIDRWRPYRAHLHDLLGLEPSATPSHPDH
jgi:tetratricopeptide (TPR) repeat protein